MRFLAVATLLTSLAGTEAHADPPISGITARIDSDVGIYDLAFSPDGNRLAGRSGDNMVRIWNLASQEQLARIDGHVSRVSDLCFSPDGRHLLTAAFGEGEAVRVWASADGELLDELPPDSIDLNWSRDGRLHVLRPNRIDAYSFAGGKYRQLHQQSFDANIRLDPSALPLAVSNDGQWLARSMKLGPLVQLFLQNLSAAGEGRLQLNGIGQIGAAPADIAFSPDPRWLALCVRRRSEVQLWNLERGENRQLRGHSAAVEALAFAPHGQLIATASWDHTVRLWELSTGDTVLTLRGHQAHVCAVQFSADARQLASGSSGAEDNSIIVWDLAARIRGLADALDPPPAASHDEYWQQIWQQLATGPGGDGFPALAVLVRHAQLALPWIATMARQFEVTADPQLIEQAIRELSDTRFATREAAHQRLLRLRTAAEPALRQALREHASPEIQARIRAILKFVPAANPIVADDLRRWERLILALELMELPEAREPLAQLAQSQAHPQILQAALSALHRLDARSTPGHGRRPKTEN